MSLETVFANIKERAAGANPLGATLKFDMGDAGAILLDGTGDSNVVSMAEAGQDAQCTVSISKEDMGRYDEW